MLSTQVTKKTPSPAKGPRKSRFAEVGREAARKAQRELVLDELRRNDWNLTDTARALGLAHASAVSRAIEELDLADEYEQGKAAKTERDKAARAVEQKVKDRLTALSFLLKGVLHGLWCISRRAVEVQPMFACVLCHRELPPHELDVIDPDADAESALHVCRGCANPSGVATRPRRRRADVAAGAVLPWARDFNPRAHCLGRRA